MTNSEILQKVARRELTPEQAAELMLAEDERERGSVLLPGLFLAIAVIVLAIAALWASPAAAQEYEPSTDPDLVGEVIVEAPAQWSDSTRLALAQCLVAEARWRNRTEHSAIAHVLERRWRRFNAHHPSEEITFEQQIRAYCHLHRSPEDSTARWALNLSWGPMTEDPGLPSGTNWRRFRDDWDFVRETVELFERGELRDPLPRAMTFGGAMDSAGAGLVYLGPTTISVEDGARILLHNRFYALASVIRRDAARATAP